MYSVLYFDNKEEENRWVFFNFNSEFGITVETI